MNRYGPQELVIDDDGVQPTPPYMANGHARGVDSVPNEGTTEPKKGTILDEAAAATSGDRPSVYGHPKLHFACTAAMVEAYLVRRGWTSPAGGLLPEDWSQFMLLDKVARQAGSLTATRTIHRDTAVDQAGYARTSELLGE